MILFNIILGILDYFSNNYMSGILHMSNGIEILYYINTKNIQLFKTLQLELIIQPDKKT